MTAMDDAQRMAEAKRWYRSGKMPSYRRAKILNLAAHCQGTRRRHRMYKMAKELKE